MFALAIMPPGVEMVLQAPFEVACHPRIPLVTFALAVMPLVVEMVLQASFEVACLPRILHTHT